MDATAEEQFAEFTRTRWPALTRFAYSLVHDPGRAEDLVQDALVRLWKVWPRLREEQPEAYTRRIVVNLAIATGRRRWWGERATAVLPEARVEGPGAHVAERDLMVRALAKLSSKQRVVVVLRYAHDLPEAEVARMLGCSVGAVKTHASRGLKALREQHVLGLPDGLDAVPDRDTVSVPVVPAFGARGDNA
ncbi:SigE family RNA polymerase sigma factor [Yinghuangia seranimata]|uniref:SigE family RNA polymerase sigma factor n=1 Tax=Yinghuangia seranimata TaxID=408067 RepID=UPI00248C5A54|nr:SigE family RNA polymerase sigma factor [Yinghuangia seranimata]MDI2127345.1 SigE family RNA polymerase sigma factor [Yinghuangia seranimata]